MLRSTNNSSPSANAFNHNGNVYERLDSRDEFARDHGSRRRILAIMRLAYKVLGMKKRTVGRLSGGAAVTALLISMGIGATSASAQYVAGTGATATGLSTTAVGTNAKATNNLTGSTATTGSTAFGTNATATGANSTAIGDGATAVNNQPVGSGSTAVGTNAIATDLSGTAIGYGAQALPYLGLYSLSNPSGIFGSGNTAIGNLSLAIECKCAIWRTVA